MSRPRYLLAWIQYESRGGAAFIVLNWGREDDWPMWRYLAAHFATLGETP